MGVKRVDRLGGISSGINCIEETKLSLNLEGLGEM